MITTLTKLPKVKPLALTILLLFIGLYFSCVKNEINPFSNQEDSFIYNKYSALSQTTVPKILDYTFNKIINGETVNRNDISNLTYEDVARSPHLNFRPIANPSPEFNAFLTSFQASIKSGHITTPQDFKIFAAQNLKKLNDVTEKETAALIITQTDNFNSYIRKNETNLGKYITATNIMKFYRLTNGKVEIIHTATAIIIVAIVLEVSVGIITGFVAADAVCGSPNPGNNYNPAYYNCCLVGGLVGGITAGVLAGSGLLLVPAT